MKRILALISHSFQVKLLLFNLIMVILTAAAIFLYLVNNYDAFINKSVTESERSVEQIVNSLVTQYVREKRLSTWDQLAAAQDNLSVLGRMAQNIVNNYSEISVLLAASTDAEAQETIFDIMLFETGLQEVRYTDEDFALTSDASASVDAYIPPEIANDPRAIEKVKIFGLLNIAMEALYDANDNNASVYFIGDEALPVMRIYPNNQVFDSLFLKEELGLLYWRDKFADNAAEWERWFITPDLQAKYSSPLTVEAPYVSDSGELVVTMFYPLWDYETSQFAGAVGADIQLTSIVDNILDIRVTDNSFSFLMNNQGEIIAMPEAGVQLFQVEFSEIEVGGRVYYRGRLSDSPNSEVQFMASLIQNGDRGYDQSSITDQVVAYESLPPLTSKNYSDDVWKIVIIIPENEIFKTFNETRESIKSQSAEIRLSSLAILVAFLFVAMLVSLRFSAAATRDVRMLAEAAKQISAKKYDVEMKLSSRDEIGQLGRVFETMASDIRDYTVNLEAKVAERTAELTEANEEIARLNEQLRGENLRLGAELDVARRLQMMILPPDKETRRIPDLDIASYMRPTDEVGGDYYDILRVGDALFICIGDVAGHGLPSGVIMLMAQTAMLTLSKTGERNMENMLSILNKVMYNNIQRIREDKNMTMAILQYKNREVSMVGQHESVLLCRKDGIVQSVDTMDLGLPIGLQEDIDGFIMTSHLRLEPGDVMILYTDGITESVNLQNELFGLDGLVASLKRCYQLTAEEIKEHILAEMFAHIGEAHIYDDIAMLVLKQK